MVYKIIQKRKIFLSPSLLAVAVSVFALFSWGLNFGIDFKGGSLLEVEFNNYQPKITEIQDALKEIDLHNLVIQPTENSFILRFKEDSEETHQLISQKLQDLAASSEPAGELKELSFDSVGPSIGQELKSKSFNAAFIVFIVIILYIAYSFRQVSKPISSWKYGLAAIVALVHDLLLILGVFAFLGHFYGTEINTPFIAAVLTVLGYSINDTIIVFDRIRENLPKSSLDFEGTVNLSVNQTLARSINTSFSSILALLAILFFGGTTIKDFALALTIGVFVGAYSSIFVASPVLVIWEKMQARRRA